MFVILLRHGDKLSGADPELNSIGHQQAQQLGIDLNFLPKNKTTLLCSPKKRTRQTLTPLSRALAVKLTDEPRLQQREHHESQLQFQKRIQNLLNEFNLESQSLVVLCSHVDVLEELRFLIPCFDLQNSRYDLWEPAQYVFIDWTSPEEARLLDFESARKLLNSEEIQ